MNITVNSSNLARALKSAGRAIPAKASLPVLECYLIQTRRGRLTITASNTEITVKAPVAIIDNREDGVCAVPAKKFLEHISLLPDCDVTLATQGNAISISWEKGKTSMQMMDASDYPSITEPDGADMMNMPAQELLAALGVTIPASSKDDTRPQLCGVHFDILEDRTRLVASDTRTLTYDTVGCTTGRPDCFTIPTGAATLLKGSIRKESTVVRLTHDANSVCFNLGDVIIQTRKVVGRYPRYMTIIPTERDITGTAVTDRERLIGSLKRLAACSMSLRMTLTPLSLFFSARNTENGSSSEEDCDCNYNGGEMSIGLNPQRFLNILENLPTEKVCLMVTSPTKPLIATGQEDARDNSLSLFMPVLAQ